MRTKKTVCLLLVLALLVTVFAGCGTSSRSAGKKSIVVTIFPIYDWVRQILGDEAENWELTFLLDNGVDLHSYQATADDMVKIAGSDLFLYVGGTSDRWVDDALKHSGGSAVSLLSLLGGAAKTEERVEGMQPEEEEDEELDEHVWLSLRNAALFCSAIADAIAEIDPAHAQTYRRNADGYIAQLNALDADYADVVANAARRTVLFADRFPFRYLTDDYGLTYYAAFSGCSAEAEASFETVVFLAGKIDELDLPGVLTLEGSDHSLALTILQNTTRKSGDILTLDSMQSTTLADANAGASYLTIMRLNLDALRAALN